MSNWTPYNNGSSVGQTSAEGGVILRDEEHQRGARITLKQGKTFIAVSCHIYGWIDHTRFFHTLTEAQREYIIMRAALGSVMEDVAAGANDIKMWEAIANFVKKFP